MNSTNFTVWYNQHRDSAIKRLNKLYLNMVSQCNVKEVIKDFKPVQVIDFFMRIREHAVCYLVF